MFWPVVAKGTSSDCGIVLPAVWAKSGSVRARLRVRTNPIRDPESSIDRC
jgi:hypothetical protein